MGDKLTKLGCLLAGIGLFSLAVEAFSFHIVQEYDGPFAFISMCVSGGIIIGGLGFLLVGAIVEELTGS